MLEILQYYTSDFWVWLGITVGMWCAAIIVVFFVGALRGNK